MTPTESKNTTKRNSSNYFLDKGFWIKLLFLAMAALLWFLTKLSQDGYTDKLIYIINVVEPETEMVIADVSIESFEVTVEANGYDLLSENTTYDKSLFISLDDADRVDDNTYVWDSRKNSDILSRQLSSKLRIKQISPKTITIKIDKLVKKNVKVIPDFTVNLDAPYRVYDHVIIKPKTVELWMPSYLADSIGEVYTEQFSIVSEDPEQSITLDLSGLDESFIVKPNKVEARFKVKPYTQKTLEIPIQIKNVPVDGQVRLFPDKVKATMNIAQDEYDLISEKDFVCVADFEQMNQEQSRVSLNLSSVPNNIELIDWGQKSVEFIIIRK